MRGNLLSIALLCTAAVAGGCFDAELVECGDGRACPVGTACDVINQTCVVEGDIGVSADDIEFLDTPCGTTGSHSVVVTNPGTTAITLGAMITPSTLGVEPAESTIPPGGSVELVVTLDAATGARPGDVHGGLLTLTTERQEIERVVRYSTTGTLITAASTVDAGEVGPGGSATRTFSVRNAGTIASELTITNLSAPFSMPMTSPILLEPGVQRELVVVFEPDVVSDVIQTPQLSFTGNHCQAPPTEITMTGRASGDAMLASSTTVRFLPAACGEEAKAHIITLRSQSDEEQVLSAYFIGNAQGLEVSAPPTLPPSPGTATVTVKRPLIEAPHALGSYAALLQITATAGAVVTKSIPVEYTLQAPTLVAMPPVINLAGDAEGHILELQNTGTAVADVRLTILSQELLEQYGLTPEPKDGVLGELEFMTVTLQSEMQFAPGDLPPEGVKIGFESPGMCSAPAEVSLVTQ